MWRWLTALFLVAFPNSTGRFVFSLTFGVGIDVLSLATSVFTCMAFVEGSAVSGIHWISYRFVSACRIDRRAFRWDAFGWVYLTSLSYGWSRDGDVGEPPGRSDATCLIVDRGGVREDPSNGGGWCPWKGCLILFVPPSKGKRFLWVPIHGSRFVLRSRRNPTHEWTIPVGEGEGKEKRDVDVHPPSTRSDPRCSFGTVTATPKEHNHAHVRRHRSTTSASEGKREEGGEE